MENDDDEVCKCGDPSSHHFECALYCGFPPCHDKLVKLPKCEHRLHEECLDQLLFTRLSKCPLCRSSIDQWRRTHHYHRIEEEIADAFRADTDLALRLSKEMFEEEERQRKALEKKKAKKTASESSERTRERDRDRDRNRNRSSNRSEENSASSEPRNRRNRRNRIRTFLNRARSRSRSRHRR